MFAGIGAIVINDVCGGIVTQAGVALIFGLAVTAGQTQHLWVYVTATVLGALLACGGFQIVQRRSNGSPGTTT